MKNDVHPDVYPAIYKRSANDKIIYWVGNVLEFEIGIIITTEYGELYTDNPVSTSSDPISGKNIGKSNETTPLEQAHKELKSIYKKQAKKGYKSLRDLYDKAGYDFPYEGFQGTLYEVLDAKLPKYNTDANDCIKPMKAQKFVCGKFKYPCIKQPKINGVRAVVMFTEIKEYVPASDLFAIPKVQHCCVIKSKEGLEYNIDHIQNVFDNFYITYPEHRHINFDGEIYICNEAVATIGGAARNPNNPKHKDLTYICFDLSIPDLSNEERDIIRFEIYELLCETDSVDDVIILIKENHNSKYISDYKVLFLESDIAKSDNDAIDFMTECIDKGYEGAILRNPEVEYKFGQRASTMVKLKSFTDSEFKILGIKHVGNPNLKVGFTVNFVCQNDINDEIFEPTVVGTVEERMEYVNNPDKYIGKYATVKFYERTEYGIPFHANVISVRDYE